MANENINNDFEDENVQDSSKVSLKKQKKALQKEKKKSATMISPEKGDFHAFTLRVRKARSKAISAGNLYLFLTILFGAMAFLPLFITSSGSLTVINFWRPFRNILYIKGHVVPGLLSLIVPVLYCLLLLTAFINVLKALSNLGELHRKPSKKKGANRNADVAEKIGKIYSGTFASIIIFGLLMKIVSGVHFTPMFYAVVSLGIILHFLTAFAAGNISRFNLDEKGNSEAKHMYGRFAPFIRNLFQWLTCGILIYYFMKFNTVSYISKLFERGAFSTVIHDSVLRTRYLLSPALQILMGIFLICLFNHAAGNTEYANGAKQFFLEKKRVGAKTTRVFALLLVLTVAGYEIILALDKDHFGINFSLLYFGIAAFALFIEEIFMAKLPNLKENVLVYYQNEQEPMVCPHFPAYAGYNFPFTNQNANVNDRNVSPAANGACPINGNLPANGMVPLNYGYPLNYIYPFNYAYPVPVMVPPISPTMTATPTAVENVKQAPIENSVPISPTSPTIHQGEFEYITRPALFMQPNGKPIMVMPMMESAPIEKSNSQNLSNTVSCHETNKVENMGNAPLPIYSAPISNTDSVAETSKESVSEKIPLAAEENWSEAIALTKEEADGTLTWENRIKTLTDKWIRMANPSADILAENSFSPSESVVAKPITPIKKVKVVCPDCGAKLMVQDGSFAYRCPECGEIFQIRKKNK